jgi:uncharacterized protein YoaH (UPF0181 family)
MTANTIRQLAISLHEATSELGKLNQCKSTLASYHLTTKPVDTLIDVKKQEIEAKTIDLEDRKERIKLYQRVSFEMMQKYVVKPEIVELSHDRGQREVDARRAKFQAAGMSTADSVAFVPDYDPAKVQAEFDARRAIGDSWRKFAESGLEADLPYNAPELLEEIGGYPVNIKASRLTAEG